MQRRSLAICSVARRPPSSTSVCVTPARNARWVPLNTAMSASTMRESSVTTSRTSTREKAAVSRSWGSTRLRRGGRVQTLFSVAPKTLFSLIKMVSTASGRDARTDHAPKIGFRTQPNLV